MNAPKKPYMGSALRAFLRRYREDLQPYADVHGDRVVLAMIDCCDFLLIEADRMEQRQP